MWHEPCNTYPLEPCGNALAEQLMLEERAHASIGGACRTTTLRAHLYVKFGSQGLAQV